MAEMAFEFVVSVRVDRLEGKFASRDEIKALLEEALESANPENLTGEAGGEYEVNTWNVSDWEVPGATPKRPNKATVKDPALNEAFGAGQAGD